MLFQSPSTQTVNFLKEIELCRDPIESFFSSPPKYTHTVTHTHCRTHPQLTGSIAQSVRVQFAKKAKRERRTANGEWRK